MGNLGLDRLEVPALMLTKRDINRLAAVAICLALATCPAGNIEAQTQQEATARLQGKLDERDESSAESKSRHRRVAERRAGTQIICHRGAVEFAHENTLDAYRAAFELGADGNEIDIRATKDGVLVCFHDDMLDHLLKAYGDVADYTEARTYTQANGVSPLFPCSRLRPDGSSRPGKKLPTPASLRSSRRRSTAEGAGPSAGPGRAASGCG